MNTQKNVIFVLGSICLIVLSLFLLASTQKIQDTATTANTISFNGEGKVTAKPDVALVKVVIFSEAATSKEAEQINTPKSKAVIDFLKKQGIAEKDIQTYQYEVTPQYSYPERELPKVKGYQAYQGLEVKIREINKTGSIIAGAISAGASKVSDTRLVIDNPEKLQDEARAKAIAEAKKKARDLEKQLGIKLGKIVNFYENNGDYPVPMYLEAKDMKQGIGGPELPAGENEITSNITITYQIK